MVVRYRSDQRSDESRKVESQKLVNDFPLKIRGKEAGRETRGDNLKWTVAESKENILPG